MELLKGGRAEFRNWLSDNNGDPELLDTFLKNRQRYQSPENNMDWWVKNKKPEDLENFIKNYKSKSDVEKEKNKKDQEVAHEGSELIYEDDNWRVLHLLTYKAAQYYGKNSRWCICGNYEGHESQGEEYFNNYLRSSYRGYYVFLNKKPRKPSIDAKYMVCIKKSDPHQVDIWNQADSRIEVITNGPTIPNFPSVTNLRVIDKVLVKVVDGRNTLEIPSTVTSIATRAVEKTHYDSVILPNTLVSIGSAAFLECKSLGQINIPKSVTKIGDGAFAGCTSLSGVSINGNIEVIPRLAFAYDDFLEFVYLPDSLKEIADDAFKGVIYFVMYCHDSNEVVLNYGIKHKIKVVSSLSGEILFDPDHPENKVNQDR